MLLFPGDTTRVVNTNIIVQGLMPEKRLFGENIYLSKFLDFISNAPCALRKSASKLIVKPQDYAFENGATQTL